MRDEFRAAQEKLTKKIRKGDLALQKVKQRYDEVCVNGHGLAKMVEELRESEMKRRRAGGDDQKLYIEDKKDDIRNAVRGAQIARQMKIIGKDPEAPEGRRVAQVLHPLNSVPVHERSGPFRCSGVGEARRNGFHAAALLCHCPEVGGGCHRPSTCAGWYFPVHRSAF